jgi:hypothetical protein
MLKNDEQETELQDVNVKTDPAVTTTWRVLWFRMEKLPPDMGSSRGQPTRGGPPDWGLGDVLTTPHRKHLTMLPTIYERYKKLSFCLFFIWV